VSNLHDDVIKRVKDPIFTANLIEKLERTYGLFLAKKFEIFVNGSRVRPLDLMLSENRAVESLKIDDVSVQIIAGLASPAANGKYISENSGWFIFCNGRAVLTADKSALTGWTGQPGLPLFQPKHRPFLGLVIFLSDRPESLPWTTTKSSINEDSSVWLAVKPRMINIGREVISVLDRRYGNDGTEFSLKELKDVGGGSTSLFSAVRDIEKKYFSPPTIARPEQIRIQYSAYRSDVEKIESYLGVPGMGGAEVGRYTFNYFLKSRVGEDG
jgi:hypothetical protein